MPLGIFVTSCWYNHDHDPVNMVSYLLLDCYLVKPFIAFPSNIFSDSYDDILVNGLPDWRQPVFYYRRVRKMSNGELGFLLFLILTVGHYAVIWSIYLEKQLVNIARRLRLASRNKRGMWNQTAAQCCSVFAHRMISLARRRGRRRRSKAAS